VAVVGCGPLGLSAVQGARIAGASTIIGIDPIRMRRDVAMKVGATHVLDPNVEGDKLIERVRALTAGPTNGRGAGDGRPAQRRGRGSVAEAAGGVRAVETETRPAFCRCRRPTRWRVGGGHTTAPARLCCRRSCSPGGVTHRWPGGRRQPMREMLHAPCSPGRLGTRRRPRVVGLRYVLGATRKSRIAPRSR
jgi:threonine dehydrogenase-like Zn-dependent dehydrogenase